MRSSQFVSLAVPLVAYAAGVTAHFDWIDGLDNCWQDCLDSNGCSSQKCICDASATDSYLQNSLNCVKSECDTAAWLDLGLLAPLQVFCAASGDAIPQSIMDNAYDCATATSAPVSTTTRKAEYSPTTTAKGSNALRETTTSIFTQTTTDGDGRTLQLVVPIVMGPETLSTGKIATSTLESDASSTSASAPASTTSNAVEPSQLPGAPSSSPTAEPTQAGSGGGGGSGSGSLLENMQAAATRFGLSSAAIGLGAVAGVFVIW